MLLQERVYSFIEGSRMYIKDRQKVEYEIEQVVLFIVLSGAAEIQCDSRNLRLEISSVFLIKPQGKFKVKNIGDTELIMICSFFQLIN